MAATYTKPTSIPRWADTGTTVEPGESKKDAGWVLNETPPYSWENWKSKLIGDWFKWFDERIFDIPNANSVAIKAPGTTSQWRISDGSIGNFVDKVFFGASAEMAVGLSTGGQHLLIMDGANEYAAWAFAKISGQPWLSYTDDRASLWADLPATSIFTMGGGGEWYFRRKWGGGTTIGPELNLINPNRTGDGTWWKIKQYQDRLNIAFDNLLETNETDLLRFYPDDPTYTGHPSCLIHDDFIMRPDEPGTDTLLGASGHRWGAIYTEHFYHYKHAHCYAYLSADVGPISTTDANITPDIKKISQNISSTSSPDQRFTFSVTGRYLITANIMWAGSADTTGGAFYFKLNGSVLDGSHTGLGRVFDYAHDTDFVTTHLSAIIDINADTDYLQLFAVRVSGSGQFDVEEENTSMCITLIREE